MELFDAPREQSELLLGETLEMIERKHILQVLERTNWKVEGANGAAKVLGLNPSTLRTRMSRLGILKGQANQEKTFVEH